MGKLEKAFNTKFNFEEFENIRTCYFLSILNWPKNKSLKKMDSSQKKN